jgi:hypothetical protein
MISSREFDIARAFDRSREKARVLDVTDLVADCVHDQRRHPDGRSNVANVDLERHPHERFCRGRRG